MDPHYGAGVTRVVPLQEVARPGNTAAAGTLDRKLEESLGKPVLVRGHEDPDFVLEPIKHEGPCLAAQMRSDWVPAKEGYRMEREEATGAPTISGRFVAESIEPFDGIKVSKAEDKVVVSFTNPFDFALDNVVLSVHYEGCYGKPGAPTESRESGRIEPKTTATATFPTIVKMDRGAVGHSMAVDHIPWSVQVTTLTTRTVFDFDWRLDISEKGLNVTCPR